MNQLNEAPPLTVDEYEDVCRDLASNIADVLQTRREYQRFDVALAVLLQMHRGLCEQLPQDLRRAISFDIATYAGDLMAAPRPDTTH